MVDYIPQTRHPRLFLVMLASIGYMEGAGVMCLNNLINKFFLLQLLLFVWLLV